MAFDKIVLYDFEENPLEDNFLDKLREKAEELDIVYTEGDYTEKLSPEHLKGADALISRVFDDYPEELFEKSNLEYVGVMATDSSHYPKECLRNNDITLKHVPEYATESVAELTISMLLNLSLRNLESMDFVREGKWDIGPFQGKELRGKTIGIIGLGRIGFRVAELAEAFGMDIIYYSRSEKDWAAEKGYGYVNMEELCKKSDVVSLHCSLNPETRNILSSRRLEMLKEGAIVLNAAREELQDVRKTIELCEKDKIKAWFDALEDEEERQEILETENALLTSHSGCATKEAQRRLKKRTIENIEESS